MENEIYKAPDADLEPEINQNNAELASRGSRLVASIIDTLIIFPVSILLLYVTGGFESLSEGQSLSLLYTIGIAVVSTIIFLMINGKIMLRDGQTWGKKLQKIKIVTVHDDHADLKTLAKRYGFYWGLPQLPLIGQFFSMVNILFIFSKSKCCIHDYVGGTKVVKTNQ